MAKKRGSSGAGKKNRSGLYFFVAAIVVLVIVAFAYYYFADYTPAPVNEDGWIKGANGVWVKSGNPSETPNFVVQQQDAIKCGERLYRVQKPSGAYEYTSECLGKCGDYAVDIVHVPRTKADDLKNFQCLAYLNGDVKNLIEMDKDGNVVKVLD